jgi:hypothetical protein
MEFHKSADLAFARFERQSLPDFIRPLVPFRGEEILLHGTPVSAFGFPLTSKRLGNNGSKQYITVNEVFFSGYISSIYDKEHLRDLVDQPFDQNYVLSFECPKGLSGAPLLLNHQGSIVAAGIVYGNQSISFLIDEYEETKSDGKTTRREIVKLYHFGLASSHEVFSEIPPLA